MRVWLDDAREAPEGWVHTRTVQETIDCLKTDDVEELSLDHDLGDENVVGNGYQVLLWIEEQVVQRGFKPPHMEVHSANPPAHDKMMLAIKSINRMTDQKGDKRRGGA